MRTIAIFVFLTIPAFGQQPPPECDCPEREAYWDALFDRPRVIYEHVRTLEPGVTIAEPRQSDPSQFEDEAGEE